MSLWRPKDMLMPAVSRALARFERTGSLLDLRIALVLIRRDIPDRGHAIRVLAAQLGESGMERVRGWTT